MFIFLWDFETTGVLFLFVEEISSVVHINFVLENWSSDKKLNFRDNMIDGPILN